MVLILASKANSAYKFRRSKKLPQNLFSNTYPFGQFGIKVPYTKSVSFKIIPYLKKVIIIGRKIAVNIPLSPIASAPNAAAFSLISIARAVPIP